MTDLKRMLIDLEILANSARGDYQNSRWPSYPDFIREFNRLLATCHDMGLDIDIEAIQAVPEGKTLSPHMIGAGTPAEIAKMREIVDKSERLFVRVRTLISQAQESDLQETVVSIIERICTRFHLIVRQLGHRREQRPTLRVEDEYDVQDLMHSLLCLYFDDIRKEEWTPSYAGGASRMDFLVKNEKTVVETKKTREGLGGKEIGEQLMVDIDKYSKHPDCRVLICFVYDPEMRIGSPRGLERDLQQKGTDDLQILVFIRPTGL